MTLSATNVGTNQADETDAIGVDVSSVPSAGRLILHINSETNSTSPVVVDSISGLSVTWTRRAIASFVDLAPGQSSEEWYADVDGTVSGTVTATFSGEFDDATMHATLIASDTLAPISFDTNGSLPGQIVGNPSYGPYSTDSTAPFILLCGANGFVVMPTSPQPAGTSNISQVFNNDAILYEYSTVDGGQLDSALSSSTAGYTGEAPVYPTTIIDALYEGAPPSDSAIPAFGAGYAPIATTPFLQTEAVPAFGAGYAPIVTTPFLQTEAVPAFGAGYAPIVTRSLKTAAIPAFGAGYAQKAREIISGSPITPTDDGYAFLGRNRTFSATASIYVPPVAPPAGIHLAGLGIPRVSETYDPPTVINGLPYASSALGLWLPASVERTIWAKQLQFIVGGEDVTFFRGAPTVVSSWASQEPFGDASAVFQLPAVTSFDNLRQPLAVPVGATVGTAGTYTGNGYWTASALGLVTGFGDAAFYGDPLGLLNEPIVGITASRVGYGYALVAADGGVFCFGDVQFYGSLPPSVPPRPIVGMALTEDEGGYWLVDQIGQFYAFGDAPALTNISLVGDDVVTAIAPIRGNGCVVLTAQGRLYFFGGDVTDFGNVTSSYVAPFVGIGTAPGVDGYVIINTLGQTYFPGGLSNGMSDEGGVVGPLNAPANAVWGDTATGYWIGAEDGGVFAYGAAQFYGSVPGGGTTDGGSLSWLTLGGDITINAIRPDDSVFTVFEGVIADWEDASTDGSVGLNVQCVGSLFQADWYVAKPIPNLPFQGYSPDTGNPIFGWDIAQAIPAAFASVFDPSAGTAIGNGPVPTPRSSPFNANACVLNLGGASETGILTVTQPAWDKLLTSYVQNILSQAQSYGGVQYTVNLQRPRTPVLQVKDFETVNWTVSTGGRGVKPDLSLDITTAANAIYGSGTAPPVLSTVAAGSSTTVSGLAGSWQGAKYPQFPPPPSDFPLGTGASFSPGDGQTGLQVFTNWMRQSGWPMVSQDTYLATSPSTGVIDYYLIISWQIQAGIEATGLIDVNTWNAVFNVGDNTGAISNVFYSPLAELPLVEPYTYTPSGAIQGVNPFYNPAVPRIERYEAMGSQVSKAQGILSATIELDRIQVPSWTGTITLTADPQEGSRFEIVAGQNILLRYFHGRDTLFHVSAVSVDFTTESLSVQLTVASQPLDLITLAAIYARDYGAHGVSRQARPSLVNLNVSSNTTTFDSESAAGQVPPVYVAAGTWSVYRMAASQYGSIAETNLTASPATPFAVAVFSGPVTPSDLTAIFALSNGPLNDDIATGNNPWNDFAADLDNLGLLYGAGGPSGACGYWPSDPSGTQTLTGQYVDGQTWPYTSAPGYSPWLWVAFYAVDDCFISGRFLPAPASSS